MSRVALPTATTGAPEPAAHTTSARAARTAAQLAKQLELALSDVDLTLPQYRALAHLERGTAAPSTLAGQLAVTRPTITALIDGLVARGLVERRPDPSDGRRVSHVLTAGGAGSLARADQLAADRLAEILDHLTERDRKRALNGLLLFSDALVAWAEARGWTLPEPAQPEPAQPAPPAVHR